MRISDWSSDVCSSDLCFPASPTRWSGSRLRRRPMPICLPIPPICGAMADADLLAHPAYLWREGTLSAVADFRALPLERLTGIDTQKQALLRNTRRLANGLNRKSDVTGKS